MSIGIAGLGNDYYSQIASGKKIQGAADDAASVAIAQELTSQTNGYEMGTRNAENGKSVLNVADGALSGIADHLQQIRGLAVQASNSAILSNGDRSVIQDQIDQLKQGIADIANNTEFNSKKLLNGSNDSMRLTTGANGQGTQINTGNATLEALGIKDFDVRGKFDIQTIDDALQKVNDERGSVGAQSNSLDYTIGYNTQTAYNLTKATSETEDADIAKVASEQKKQQVLDTMRFMIQKQQEEDVERKANLLI